MDNTIEKMERDFSNETDQALIKSNEFALAGHFLDSIESLFPLEKQARNAGDSVSCSRILLQIIELCFKANNIKELCNQLTQLTKKRGQLKQAITAMIQKVIEYLDKLSIEDRLQVLATLRQVTEGKMFLEVERARLTKILADIKEASGNLKEATELMHDLQVETFGSMDKREKILFLLEQMRLGLAIRDFVRTEIISRKISVKFFADKDQNDLKLRYFEYMIILALHESDFLACAKHYLKITDCLEGEKQISSYKFAIILTVLAQPSSEQKDLLNSLLTKKWLEDLQLYKELLRSFNTPELMRWGQIQQIYSSELSSTFILDFSLEDGRKRWEILHDRITEHNLRTISLYYSRMTLSRLSAMLDLNQDRTEAAVAKLSLNKDFYGKIDRPAGLIEFKRKSRSSDSLNRWSANLQQMMSLVEKTCHLIAKEEMIQQISAK